MKQIWEIQILIARWHWLHFFQCEYLIENKKRFLLELISTILTEMYKTYFQTNWKNIMEIRVSLLTYKIINQGKCQCPSRYCSSRSWFLLSWFDEMSIPRRQRSWRSKSAFLNWRPTMPASIAASTFRILIQVNLSIAKSSNK